MADNRYRSTEEARRQEAESAWLQYFNRVLYEQEVISEQQRNQISGMIANRKPFAPKQRKHDLAL